MASMGYAKERFTCGDAIFTLFTAIATWGDNHAKLLSQVTKSLAAAMVT
jgi:hypothetical protein